MSTQLRLMMSLGLALAGSGLHAQTLGTAFTYQGQLTEGGQPATGLYDLQLCLFASASAPTVLACAPDFEDVPVSAGVFTVTPDFGAGAFVGQQRFLELRVRPGASSGAYTILAPRQLVRATPEALRANSASVAPWSGLTGVPAGFADGIDNSGDINRATLSWDVASTTGVATSRIYPLVGPGAGAAANATEFDILASRFSTACSMTATARIYPAPVAGQDSILRLYRVNASDPLGTLPSEISLVAFNAPGVDTVTSSPISILAGQRVMFRYTKAANSTPLPVPTKIYVEWTCN